MSHSTMSPVTLAEPDEQLAAAVRDGSDRALSQLFERYAGVLFRLAYRITGTREDAEDVVQDVFLGLRIALLRYEEREALAGWLRRLAARRALMQLRAASRQSARDAAAAPDPLQRNQDDRLSTTLTLRDAVSRLPEPLRQAFVLADVEGFTHAEIAELLGITEAASRKRRHRAVAQLQSALRSSR